MSGETTASTEPTGEPTNEVGGELSGTERAIALAKISLKTRLAERDRVAAEKGLEIHEATPLADPARGPALFAELVTRKEPVTAWRPPPGYRAS